MSHRDLARAHIDGAFDPLLCECEPGSLWWISLVFSSLLVGGSELTSWEKLCVMSEDP